MSQLTRVIDEMYFDVENQSSSFGGIRRTIIWHALFKQTEEVAAVTEKPRRSASRSWCCEQRSTLTAINL